MIGRYRRRAYEALARAQRAHSDRNVFAMRGLIDEARVWRAFARAWGRRRSTNT
jgi:hypothetical protein